MIKSLKKIVTVNFYTQSISLRKLSFQEAEKVYSKCHFPLTDMFLRTFCFNKNDEWSNKDHQSLTMFQKQKQKKYSFYYFLLIEQFLSLNNTK